MKRKYQIIEVRQDGSRRLLVTALTVRAALRLKLDLSKRFGDSTVIIEKVM